MSNDNRLTSFLLNKERLESRKRKRDAAMKDVHGKTPKIRSAVAADDYISVYTPHQIQRNRTCDIISNPMQKLYTVNYDKRVVLPDFNTIPYGY
jgi:hypothetical protein